MGIFVDREQLAEIVRQAVSDVVAVSDWPRWLPLKTACKYSALGKDRLMALSQAGVIVGFQDPEDGRRGWIFDRLSIDRWRESQASGAAASMAGLAERFGL